MLSQYDEKVNDRVIHNAQELYDAIKSDPMWEYDDEDSEVLDDHIYISLASGYVSAREKYATYASCFWDLNDYAGTEIGEFNMAYPFTMKHFSMARDAIESACSDWIGSDVNPVNRKSQLMSA